MHMRLFALITCLLLAMACGRGGSKGLYDIEDEEVSLDEQEVEELIAELAKSRDPDDAEASMAYDKAVNELTMKGSTVETYLVEALVGDDDWAVRYGVINVLDSVGTKNCIDALIGALDDEHPLVVQKAMFTLRVMCDHQVVPTEGGIDLRGLAPIPERASDDLRPDADYQIWLEWHQHYGGALHKAWKAWWDDNLHLVRIE